MYILKVNIFKLLRVLMSFYYTNKIKITKKKYLGQKIWFYCKKKSKLTKLYQSNLQMTFDSLKKKFLYYKLGNCFM